MKLVDVEVALLIDRPVADVAAFSAEPDHAPSWYRRIRTAKWETDPPLRVGSRFAFVARFLGRTLAYTYEVTEFESERILRMCTSEGPFPMRTTYRWEPVGEASTRMSLRSDGAPEGFSGFVAPLMTCAMRRAMKQDLVTLKHLLEAPRSLDARGQPG